MSLGDGPFGYGYAKVVRSMSMRLLRMSTRYVHVHFERIRAARVRLSTFGGEMCSNTYRKFLILQHLQSLCICGHIVAWEPASPAVDLSVPPAACIAVVQSNDLSCQE